MIGSPEQVTLLCLMGEICVIQNLNPMTFRGFGSILSERPQSSKTFDIDQTLVLNESQTDAVVYRAMSETWVNMGSGMSVLSVSMDGEDYQHFYLDKPVCVKEQVFFAVTAFRGDASAAMAAKIQPEIVGRRSNDSHCVNHRLRIDGLYTFFYQEKEQGFLFPGESHPMCELTYVDQGAVHSVADGQDLLLKQGDLVIYGPDQWHMQYADIGVAPRYVTISFDLSGVDLQPLMNRKFTAPQQVVTLLQLMLREQERMDSYSEDMIISQLTMLLLVLLREAEMPSGRKLQTSNSVHSENEIIRQAQQYVSTHIREKLSVPLLARQVDVSPSYLTALFHKNLQISPGEYIRRSKLQESKQMIRENDLNFTEIARTLQYSTVHHFSRQFKEKFGITPTEYAKSVR